MINKDECTTRIKPIKIGFDRFSTNTTTKNTMNYKKNLTN